MDDEKEHRRICERRAWIHRLKTVPRMSVSRHKFQTGDELSAKMNNPVSELSPSMMIPAKCIKKSWETMRKDSLYVWKRCMLHDVAYRSPKLLRKRGRMRAACLQACGLYKNLYEATRSAVTMYIIMQCALRASEFVRDS